MRTTINLDDDLLCQAKQLAAQTRRTLTAILEDALREAVRRAAPDQPRTRVTLPVSDRVPGTLPGVDLDNSAALLDLMERPDAPA
ncbi:MAG: DUF2191 domain-containing protein [Planctomycetes bacterium]|nr:DUF2191 domain-containing protein [Planctomycetota bacterium]